MDTVINNIYFQMYAKTIKSFSELPQKESQRNCTDVFCLIVGTIFPITMFVLALCFMNKDNYYRSNFPTDSDSIPCSYDKNQIYSYVYFPDINNIEQRVCLSSCPQQSDLELDCNPNTKVTNCMTYPIYDTQISFQRLGGFCLPTDQAMREKLVGNSQLNYKWQFMDTYDTLRISLIISLFVGIIWFILVQCFPKIMSVVAVVMAVVTLVALGTIIIADQPRGWEGNEVLKYIAGSVMILMGLGFSCLLCMYRRKIKLCGILLHWGSQMFIRNMILMLWVPIFIIFTIAFLVLILFQYLAFNSHNQPQKSGDDIYLKLNFNTVCNIFVIIQFFWGLQFLKDAFNFIISGNATEWYIKGDQMPIECCLPFSRLLKFNWGSVVAGSFLNAFFNIPAFIVQSFRCYPDGCCSVCSGCCNSCLNSPLFFCLLVRTDAYSYINLTGIPYCNAATNCSQNCKDSKLFIGDQSVLFFYRTCSYITCVILVVICCYWLMKAKIDGINIVSLGIVFILAYCIISYFIDLHADSAQGLQTAYLLQLKFSDQKYQKLSNTYTGSFKAQMRGMENSYIDGQCC